VYRRRWLTRFIERAGKTKCAECSRLLPAPGGTLDNVNDARIDGSLDKITKMELESVLQGSYIR